MSVYFRTAAVTVAVFGLLVSTATAVPPESAQEARGPVRGPRGVVIAARSAAELRDWDRRVDRMLRGGELRVRQTREDPLVPGRTHQRADQYHRGVRVFGGDIARQLRGGATESVFGTVYEGIELDPEPGIDENRARALLEERTGARLDPSVAPELVVLPLDAGGYALTWRLRVTTRTDARQYFIDARTGAAVLDYSDRKGQSAVGRARGVLGDTKKISVRSSGGQFVTSDELRPPSIQTYDMRGDPFRVDDFLNRRITLSVERSRVRLRQRLDRRRGRRRARLRRVDLRLLLQALQPERARQREHPDRRASSIRSTGRTSSRTSRSSRTSSSTRSTTATGSWCSAKGCRPGSRSTDRRGISWRARSTSSRTSSRTA